jgi:Lar family restriction alleviation protein
MSIGTLKPCPFCGSTNVRLWKGQTVGTGDNGIRFVRCFECGSRGPFSEQSEAIDAWNKRVESEEER